MVFKKHLSKIGGKRGKVVKQKGKGASDYESDPMAQMSGNYAKPAPEEEQLAPPAAPTAAMPGMIGGGMGLPPDETE